MSDGWNCLLLLTAEVKLEARATAAGGGGAQLLLIHPWSLWWTEPVNQAQGRCDIVTTVLPSLGTHFLTNPMEG